MSKINFKDLASKANNVWRQWLRLPDIDLTPCDIKSLWKAYEFFYEEITNEDDFIMSEAVQDWVMLRHWDSKEAPAQKGGNRGEYPKCRRQREMLVRFVNRVLAIGCGFAVGTEEQKKYWGCKNYTEAAALWNE